MTLWLYLHFPTLQLDVMYQHRENALQPIIIVDDKKNEVVQLNANAKQAGISLGMGLGTASSLSSQLQVKPYEQAVEKRVLTHIARWLYSISADIALFPPNGLLLKVSNMLSLYQNLTHYWQTITQHLDQLSLSYSYCTGYSPYMARLLARQHVNEISDDIAWLRQQVSQQALSNAELTLKEVERLQKVGVNTLGDLLTIPLTELSKRFTLDIVTYIGRLNGHLQHSITYYIPPENFEQYLELFYEISNNLYLVKPLTKLFRLLERYLTLKDKLASEVLIVFHQRDNADLTLSITAAQGEYKHDKWLQLTQLTLTSTTLAAPVIGITLKTKRIINKYLHKTDLFLGSQGTMSAQELTSILIAKLGKDKVKMMNIVDDDRPEIANQLVTPFTVTANKNDNSKLRPTVLLPTPLPLTEKVTLLPFPERIATGWWDDKKVIRDYFIARSHQGRWLWLFRDNHQRWFVHGIFS